MPYAILKFKLPEEKDEFKLAQRGGDYFCFLLDLDNQLRNWEREKEACPFKNIKELIVWLRKKLAEVEIWDIE